MSILMLGTTILNSDAVLHRKVFFFAQKLSFLQVIPHLFYHDCSPVTCCNSFPIIQVKYSGFLHFMCLISCSLFLSVSLPITLLIRFQMLLFFSVYLVLRTTIPCYISKNKNTYHHKRNILKINFKVLLHIHLSHMMTAYNPMFIKPKGLLSVSMLHILHFGLSRYIPFSRYIWENSFILFLIRTYLLMETDCFYKVPQCIPRPIGVTLCSLSETLISKVKMF